MAEQSDKPTANGVDPLQRLASIKPPRDLSLGGVKPNTNKKVFTPNLNVTRNRNKGPEPNVLNNKREDKGKRDRNRNKNFKNGPNIIKSAGIFSEGLGSAEISRRSAYFGRDSDPRPTLQKPTIRVKDVVKIDKEFEEQRIRSVVGDSSKAELESEDFKHVLAVDAPVKLPMDDGGWVHSQPKPPVKIKREVVVKDEPVDDVECSVPAPIIEEKPKVDVKELFEDTNVVNLLRSENPTLILLQLPDTLPGRGGSTEDETPRRRQGPSTSSGPEKSEEKPADSRCRLSDLEEGRIGTMQVHRSGKVTFKLGDTAFEVCSGTKAAFHQEVVSVSVDESSRSASVISLGPLQHKLNITPEWESMFSKIVV